MLTKVARLKKFDKRTEPIDSLWWTKISSNSRFSHRLERCACDTHCVAGKWERRKCWKCQEIRKHYWQHAALGYTTAKRRNASTHWTLKERERAAAALSMCIEKITLFAHRKQIHQHFRFLPFFQSMENTEPTCDSRIKVRTASIGLFSF